MGYPEIRFVSAGDLFPELGVANFDEDACIIREDLPPLVTKGVIAHKIGHLRIPTHSEPLAIAYSFLTVPLASCATVFYILMDARQRNDILAELRARCGWHGRR
jgi:hypothetical protein